MNHVLAGLLLVTLALGCSSQAPRARDGGSDARDAESCGSTDLPDADLTSCTSVDDCTRGPWSLVTCTAQCHCPGCAGRPMNAASAAALAAKNAAVDCSQWAPPEGMCFIPPCVAPLTLACVDGHCTER